MQIIEEKLQEDSAILQQKQMNMDVTEFGHTAERIRNLVDRLQKRHEVINTNKQVIDGLLNLFANAEEEVAELGLQLKKQAEPGKAGSPAKSPSQSLDLEDCEAGQLRLENLVASTAVHIQQCENRLAGMRPRISSALRAELDTRLENLGQDFGFFHAEVGKGRALLEERLADDKYLLKKMRDFDGWCDGVEVELVGGGGWGGLRRVQKRQATFLDPGSLAHLLDSARQQQAEVDERVLLFRNLETLKDRFVALGEVETDVKHRVRRDLTQLGKRISDVSAGTLSNSRPAQLQLAISKRVKELDALKQVSDEFWTELNKANAWAMDAEDQADSVDLAHIYKPTLLNIKQLNAEAPDRKVLLDSMQRRVAEELLELDEKTDACRRSEKVSVDQPACTLPAFRTWTWW